ncbi:MAG: EI24 domain-containing protein [Rhodospirillales bacterium]|nr:EI24 domain-containing protein [Rhodospirillales bacterium]
MFGAFSKGISQLSDGNTRRILWLCILTAMAVFIFLWSTIGYLLASTAFFTVWWLETIVDFLGGLATLVLTWFLFPGVISALVGLFLDKIAYGVEERHYPGLAPAIELPVSLVVKTGLRYLAAVIVLNIGLLAFLLIPPLFPFVFYAVNGYLLSREYFELVALRRLSPDEMRAMRQAHRGELLGTGVIIMVLLTIPVINLLAPVVATAAMVHLFEGWRKNTA